LSISGKKQSSHYNCRAKPQPPFSSRKKLYISEPIFCFGVSNISLKLQNCKKESSILTI